MKTRQQLLRAAEAAEATPPPAAPLPTPSPPVRPKKRKQQLAVVVVIGKKRSITPQDIVVNNLLPPPVSSLSACTIKRPFMENISNLLGRLITFCESVGIHQMHHDLHQLTPPGWICVQQSASRPSQWCFFYGLLPQIDVPVMELVFDQEKQEINRGRCSIAGKWQHFCTMAADQFANQMRIWGGVLRLFALRMIRQHQEQQELEHRNSPISSASSSSSSSSETEIIIHPLKGHDPDVSPYGDLPPIYRLDDMCIF